MPSFFQCLPFLLFLYAYRQHHIHYCFLSHLKFMYRRHQHFMGNFSFSLSLLQQLCFFYSNNFYDFLSIQLYLVVIWIWNWNFSEKIILSTSCCFRLKLQMEITSLSIKSFLINMKGNVFELKFLFLFSCFFSSCDRQKKRIPAWWGNEENSLGFAEHIFFLFEVFLIKKIDSDNCYRYFMALTLWVLKRTSENISTIIDQLTAAFYTLWYRETHL